MVVVEYTILGGVDGDGALGFHNELDETNEVVCGNLQFHDRDGLVLQRGE